MTHVSRDYSYVDRAEFTPHSIALISSYLGRYDNDNDNENTLFRHAQQELIYFKILETQYNYV